MAKLLEVEGVLEVKSMLILTGSPQCCKTCLTYSGAGSYGLVGVRPIKKGSYLFKWVKLPASYGPDNQVISHVAMTL